MTTAHRLIKTSGSSRFLSMEVLPLGHIFIRYISSTTKPSQIVSRKVYCRVGSMVVVIQSSLNVRLQVMLRNILMSYLSCLLFINTAPYARSSSALSDRLSVVLQNVPRITRKFSLMNLLHYLLMTRKIFQKLLMFHCCRVLKIDYSPKLRDLTISLILCELSSTDLVRDALTKVSPTSETSMISSHIAKESLNEEQLILRYSTNIVTS